MERGGWIKLHRKILKWGWYDDTDTFRVFLHLLLSANHEESEWHGIPIKHGETVIGRKKLAKELKLSERRVRTSLAHLKSTNEVTIKTTNKYSLVVINNWSSYQINDQQKDQQSTSNRPAIDHTIRNKEYKKERKKRNNYSIIASAPASADIVSVFEVFKPLANPSYGNKTQRKAIEELIRAYGLEKTLAAAKYAVSIQSEKYAPVITNPYQLKAKFGELVAFKARQDKSGSKSLVAEI